uniref:CWH43-like N-terminal domain-containing protein n=1 Tax=Salmo trutta TaxID=8032 RepID=A0A673XW58_SALTR
VETQYSLPCSLFLTSDTRLYAMALYNQHVCPMDNWYRCLPSSRASRGNLWSGPTLCGEKEIKCGTQPPESCFFSLFCSTGCFMVMLIGLLRYAHIIEKHENCVLNTASLSTGWICAAGLIMVGNFQVRTEVMSVPQWSISLTKLLRGVG